MKALPTIPWCEHYTGELARFLSDQVVTEEEREDLFALLRSFSGQDFELGEDLKPTTLPLDIPCPAIVFPKQHFCFTGTFVFGQRKDCEAAVIEPRRQRRQTVGQHQIFGNRRICYRCVGCILPSVEKLSRRSTCATGAHR